MVFNRAEELLLAAFLIVLLLAMIGLTKDARPLNAYSDPLPTAHVVLATPTR
jgi:hypothetical protein